MNHKLYTLAEVSQMIQNNKVLVLAGDEELLKKLPKGNWMGGTIPYFMSPDGGKLTRDLIHVADFTSLAQEFKIVTYDEKSISQIVSHEYENGFTFLILPPLQPVWHEFGINAPEYPNIYMNPLVGWVSGVEFSEFGKVIPKTFANGNSFVDKGVAMHVKLPDNLLARIEILNLYKPGKSIPIRFPKKGFDTSVCLVNGKTMSLFDYFESVNADERFPIVANYSGAHINVGAIWDRKSRVANIFAPVFPDTDYFLAETKEIDYAREFEAHLGKTDTEKIHFACNCLMNYFTFGLEGKTLKNLAGPITFGEIAYHLLNQTFVYLMIEPR